MQRVVTVNLNGKAYQLDQDAYDFLHRYLQHEASRTRDESQRSADIAALERDIGIECGHRLHADKNVVSADDIKSIVRTLDPAYEPPRAFVVELSGDAKLGNETASSKTGERRLYQIRDGAVISGVCKGLSEYFNLDVLLVRVAFVLLAFVSSGGMFFAYLLMMFLIPYDPSRPPSMEHGIPAWTYNFVKKTKRAFSN